ncbi:acetylglutamate kinase [Parashewanella spongiae]|uniref:Acetylglutamate kinase n=1 Tax=Parashewanella spongiae TaxID=342950 RepID=A0A3A6TXR4_9GAMM|nr:acetylglutamate kinase [Parashewanella spongiae]MCL1077078.1 acetylglutamate kinase [Parashewanella spongiae]RJY17685.1 acetylglutamate kinase [Parashewanella spongiae]
MTKPLVIKIGGTILDQDTALETLLFVLTTLKGRNIILVHGGGSTVESMLNQANFTTEKTKGLRITPKTQMPFVCGVLAGSVNKHIVAIANKFGLQSVGISLTDGNMINCKKHPLDLGQVGIPSPNNGQLIKALFSSNFMPIIASIGSFENGELVNVNADDAAVAICQLVDGDLILLTDVAGVKGADGDYLQTLAYTQAEQLIKQGVISGGMTAKVNAAFAAANKLRRSIAIASWQQPEKLKGLLSGQSIGTRIFPY